MKTPVKILMLVTALAALSGCVAVPAGYYESVPVVHVPRPVYYGPSIRFGVYGGHYRHYHGGRHGHRRH